jgi:hypothetical protein
MSWRMMKKAQVKPIKKLLTPLNVTLKQLQHLQTTYLQLLTTY